MFDGRQILAIFNFKASIRKCQDISKMIYSFNLPVFHAGEDCQYEDRMEDLKEFEELEFDALACTRRIMYGKTFEFLPAFLVAEFPRLSDEFMHIAQWSIPPDVGCCCALLTYN